MRGVTAEIMAEIDNKAQAEYGIAQTVLMENAGRSVFDVISSDFTALENERIAVLCGKGNNGGDGFVISRYLGEKAEGCVSVFAPERAAIKQGPALENFNIIEKMGLDIHPIEDFADASDWTFAFTVVVDSIFGTGFKGELSDVYVSIGERVNSCAGRAYAVDTPSGLNATTGVASRGCVRAHKTITFGLAKQGFFMNDGPCVCGEVTVRGIGFPQELLDRYVRSDAKFGKNGSDQ